MDRVANFTNWDWQVLFHTGLALLDLVTSAESMAALLKVLVKWKVDSSFGIEFFKVLVSVVQCKLWLIICSRSSEWMELWLDVAVAVILLILVVSSSAPYIFGLQNQV